MNNQAFLDVKRTITMWYLIPIVYCYASFTFVFVAFCIIHSQNLCTVYCFIASEQGEGRRQRERDGARLYVVLQSRACSILNEVKVCLPLRYVAFKSFCRIISRTYSANCLAGFCAIILSALATAYPSVNR